MNSSLYEHVLSQFLSAVLARDSKAHAMLDKATDFNASIITHTRFLDLYDSKIILEAPIIQLALKEGRGNAAQQTGAWKRLKESAALPSYSGIFTTIRSLKSFGHIEHFVQAAIGRRSREAGQQQTEGRILAKLKKVIVDEVDVGKSLKPKNWPVLDTSELEELAVDLQALLNEVAAKLDAKHMDRLLNILEIIAEQAQRNVELVHKIFLCYSGYTIKALVDPTVTAQWR
jgi:hypothetical protein